MRLTRPRLSIRRLKIAVAVVAVGVQTWRLCAAADRAEAILVVAAVSGVIGWVAMKMPWIGLFLLILLTPFLGIRKFFPDETDMIEAERCFYAAVFIGTAAGGFRRFLGDDAYLEASGSEGPMDISRWSREGPPGHEAAGSPNLPPPK